MLASRFIAWGACWRASWRIVLRPARVLFVSRYVKCGLAQGDGLGVEAAGQVGDKCQTLVRKRRADSTRDPLAVHRASFPKAFGCTCSTHS